MRDITLTELLEAGCHFGHQVRRWNPAMKQFIFGQRDGVHIFDLAKTKEQLDRAREYVKQVVHDGGLVLFVGTKRQAADTVKKQAQLAGMPFVSERWLGGTLTNFAEMSKRLARLFDLKEKKQAGELKKYTKKEQLLFDREIAKLEKFFGGISVLKKLPEAIFVVDTRKENVAVREAIRTGVKVVGMVDTNGDPNIDYPIPVNDDAAKSIDLVVEAMAEAVAEGKDQVAAAEAKAAEAVSEVSVEGQKTESVKKTKKPAKVQAEKKEVKVKKSKKEKNAS